jgi:hypothetical protein
VVTVALSLSVILVVVFWLRWHASRGEASTLRRDLEKAQATVARLAKWEKVADADAAALAMVQQAQARADELVTEAQRQQAAAVAQGQVLIDSAKEEAKSIRSAATERAKRVDVDAEATRAAAHDRAEQLVAEATAKAEALAGDALKALQQADQLARTVRALENKIEGYGDRYLIPSHSLIDDLAEGTGSTEAGQRLKVIREQVRQEVKDERAATCDYVEANRRETAIRLRMPSMARPTRSSRVSKPRTPGHCKRSCGMHSPW